MEISGCGHIKGLRLQPKLGYISAARNHFGMSRAEASQLTMTEFQMLLAAKYPDQKGFTREEYDSIADDYLAKQAARRAKAKQ
ncbi:hypothetical protein AWI16_14940 [Enterobacter ludwigii]|nr:hypothetical protein AWI16_14940 [Enterobacter ludwigii]